MKVYTGSGTPIWVAPRHGDDGIIVMQGSSRIMLKNKEIAELVKAILKVSGVRGYDDGR